MAPDHTILQKNQIFLGKHWISCGTSALLNSHQTFAEKSTGWLLSCELHIRNNFNSSFYSLD